MSMLTNRDQSICSNLGIFGILISATCMIQLMVFGTSHWLVFVMITMYVFGIIAFLLLSLQKPYAPILIIISTVFTFAVAVFFIITLTFSPVVWLLIAYSVVALVLLYMEEIPRKLKERAAALRADELVWRERL